MRCAIQTMWDRGIVWLSVSGPQAVTVNTQMLHCSQEGFWLWRKVPKCWRAEKPQCIPKGWSKWRRDSERLSCSFLGEKLHGLWAGSWLLAGSPWKQLRRARPSATWDQRIPRRQTHPSTGLLKTTQTVSCLRLKNMPGIGTSQKLPFDPPNQNSWPLPSGNSSWYPAEVY